MGYPTSSDLLTFLQSGGLFANPVTTEQGQIDLTDAINGAVQAWEDGVRWYPFLKDASDVTRYYDAPEQRILQLGAGLQSLTSLTISGSTYTSGTDFWLKPNDAPFKSQPYTFIEFRTTFMYPRQKQTIVVVGKFGRVTTIPADVKNAILAYASALIIPRLTPVLVPGGLVSIDVHNSVKETYNDNPLGNTKTQYTKEFENCVKRWRRQVLA